MKMLTIVCDEKFEYEVIPLLDSVKAFTVISHVGGCGVTSKDAWTTRNKLYLVALDGEQAESLAKAVRELHIRLVEEHHGREVPLKAFLHACDLIV